MCMNIKAFCSVLPAITFIAAAERYLEWLLIYNRRNVFNLPVLNQKKKGHFGF